MNRSILSCNRISFYVAVLYILFTAMESFSQGQWIQVPTPDPSASRNLLKDISGMSSSDVWTVGEFELAPGNLRNLIMHWNGNTWQTFPGTDLGSNFNDLWGVTAITANDVWAAGTYNVPGNSRSQLLHWNGTAWSHTTLPEITGGSFLFSIDAIAGNDIWAVGGQAGSPTSPSYAVHYDGSDWTEFPVPSPGIYHNVLEAVDGIASDDIWAVGYQGAFYGDFHAMAQHWDGNSWTNVTLPSSVSSPLGELYTVTMISSNDVWAIGSTITGVMLLIHWDGTNWSTVSTAGSAGGVIAASGADIFALGDRISQWNGTNWSVIDSLNQLSYPTLGSAVTFSNGDIWAAGNTNDTYFHNLVYRSGSGPLPVMINSYSITKSGATATIQWSTTAEFNAKEFILERKADGISFSPIHRIAAFGSAHNYKLVDLSPVPGVNYYRLQLVDHDGRVTNFPVKSLNFDRIANKPYLIYPNPVVGRVMHLWLNTEEEYSLSLFDHRGQQVINRIVSGSDSSINFNIPENLASGVYMLSLVKGETVWTEKIFIE